MVCMQDIYILDISNVIKQLFIELFGQFLMDVQLWGKSVVLFTVTGKI